MTSAAIVAPVGGIPAEEGAELAQRHVHGQRPEQCDHQAMCTPSLVFLSAMRPLMRMSAPMAEGMRAVALAKPVTT